MVKIEIQLYKFETTLETRSYQKTPHFGTIKTSDGKTVVPYEVFIVNITIYVFTI